MAFSSASVPVAEGLVVDANAGAPVSVQLIRSHSVSYNRCMGRITLNLPNDVAAALAEESRQAKRGEEDLAVDLLKRALAIRRFRAARNSVIEALGDDAPDSDDDVFKRIS